MAEVVRLSVPGDGACLAGAACAMGVFDGVHLGHRYLIDAAAAHAGQAGAPAVVLTFDIDPDELFKPATLRKLMTDEERIHALAALPVDAVAVLPFTRAFAAQPPERFLADAFREHEPESLHVGSDFRFGARAAGDVSLLARWAERRGVRLCPYDLLSTGGSPVTASRIRALLAEGDVVGAGELLGRPYAVEGEVVRGRGEGASLGFATANLRLPERLQALGDGVYAAWAQVGDARFKAAVSMGCAPTFQEASATCEAHILDFAGDLYGRRIRLEFVRLLRPMIKFQTSEELVRTVTGNIEWVRDNL